MTSNIIYHYVYRITNLINNKHYYGKRSSKIEAKLDLGLKYYSSCQLLKKDCFILDYDVIIIGAGMSGLAAGIRLAHYGKKVCIFKRLCQTLGGGKVWRDLFGYRRGSDSATGKAIAGRCIFRI